MQKIMIGVGAAAFNFLPVFLAQHLGYFAELGIGVDVRRTGSTDAATKALLGGEIALGTLSGLCVG
ncbi:hypothetical protein GCM10009087_13170 [Sphingomonas oligophenolica]|uniref:ABC transporter substrate-binding protein n=1 Tax=Sphingomonas oligophenolica TaxID=301154 RepID=A0ABU9YBN1_9SPHN